MVPKPGRILDLDPAGIPPQVSHDFRPPSSRPASWRMLTMAGASIHARNGIQRSRVSPVSNPLGMGNRGDHLLEPMSIIEGEGGGGVARPHFAVGPSLDAGHSPELYHRPFRRDRRIAWHDQSSRPTMTGSSAIHPPGPRPATGTRRDCSRGCRSIASRRTSTGTR
jgi:hypothetical protein